MDFFKIKRSIKKSPSLKRRAKTFCASSFDKLTLENALGLSTSSNSNLCFHREKNQVAYPAGCVIVLYNWNTGKQDHIVNVARKTITALDFHQDGLHLVTGESGHQPAVRVWNIEDKTQKIEHLGHKFGIPVVAFCPNSNFVVSIGTQHDMVVNVWNWKNGTKIASNKISTKVHTISFAEDGKSFITCGVRHIRFWYLESTKLPMLSSSSLNLQTIPLLNRSALLGDQKSLFFCDVATGHSFRTMSSFAITREGVLCEFDVKRHLTKWVELKVSAAYALDVTTKYVFCGCSDGIIRVVDALSLNYVATFPKPHFLGISVSSFTEQSHYSMHPENATYPECIALKIDEHNNKAFAVYSDHSLYIWDIFNVKRVGKYWSGLFHSSEVWGIEMFPWKLENKQSFPVGSFVTCSSDNSVRIWNCFTSSSSNSQSVPTNEMANIYSKDLLEALYLDSDISSLSQKDSDHSGSKVEKEINIDDWRKAGARCVAVNFTGSHLAVGDRAGNVRIFDCSNPLKCSEIVKIEAHEAEVLSLEYTPAQVRPALLATASRDRMCNILSVADNYKLVQISEDHSSSVFSTKFFYANGSVNLFSCAADKSIVCRTTKFTPEFQLVRDNIIAEKFSIYDLLIDDANNVLAAACQDRLIRLYDIETGKFVRSFKGSLGDDGVILKIALDPTSTYFATSCSDKTLCLVDNASGELVASVTGHSEIVTGLKFTHDSKRLISVSGDSCIFVWKLSKQLQQIIKSIDIVDLEETYVKMPSSSTLARASTHDGVTRYDDEKQADNIPVSISLNFVEDDLPKWMRASTSSDSSDQVTAVPRPGGKWAERLRDPLQINSQTFVNSPADAFHCFRKLSIESTSGSNSAVVSAEISEQPYMFQMDEVKEEQYIKPKKRPSHLNLGSTGLMDIPTPDDDRNLVPTMFPQSHEQKESFLVCTLSKGQLQDASPDSINDEEDDLNSNSEGEAGNSNVPPPMTPRSKDNMFFEENFGEEVEKITSNKGGRRPCKPLPQHPKESDVEDELEHMLIGAMQTMTNQELRSTHDDLACAIESTKRRLERLLEQKKPRGSREIHSAPRSRSSHSHLNKDDYCIPDVPRSSQSLMYKTKPASSEFKVTRSKSVKGNTLSSSLPSTPVDSFYEISLYDSVKDSLQDAGTSVIPQSTKTEPSKKQSRIPSLKSDSKNTCPRKSRIPRCSGEATRSKTAMGDEFGEDRRTDSCKLSFSYLSSTELRRSSTRSKSQERNAAELCNLRRHKSEAALISGQGDVPSYAQGTKSSMGKSRTSSSQTMSLARRNSRPKSAYLGKEDLSEDSLDEKINTIQSKAPGRSVPPRYIQRSRKINKWKSAENVVKDGPQVESNMQPVAAARPNPQASDPSRCVLHSRGVAAPCIFCIRKETGYDEDEGFSSSNDGSPRLVPKCLCDVKNLERLTRRRHRCSESDSSHQESDTSSLSDYYIDRRDFNLASCKRAINKLEHNFKVVSGYHQQAVDQDYVSDAKDEILEVLSRTWNQIYSTMILKGMVTGSNSKLAVGDIDHLRQCISDTNMGRGQLNVSNSTTSAINLLEQYSDILVSLAQRKMDDLSVSSAVSNSDLVSEKD